ncbi:MAG TPA: hypothetical protein VF156_15185, partial [Agromyces sp.]
MRSIAATSVLTLAITGLAAGTASAATSTETDGEHQYVVLFAEGTSTAEARAAVEAAGGSILTANAEVGVATVVTTDESFVAQAAEQEAIEGTAQNRVVGGVPDDAAAKQKFREDAVERETRASTGKPADPGKPVKGAEPLADLQWDMQQI